MAWDVVDKLSEVEATDFLEECAATAAELLGMGAVGRHDLTGQIFNRLIAERELLAAYYTSIPASTLLAGLALAPNRWPGWDWGNIDEINRLRVVDPACGTGTLLMAAYRQIVQNHVTLEGAAPDNPALHRAQDGRGTGSKGMLEALATLDVRELAAWQLDEAQAIWRDFRERKFQPFHCLAVDPARIELDRRIVSDMLGLGDDAQAAVARLRRLLPSEPSIHGAKKPVLPQ